jgi:hypothetical protein
MKKRTKRIYYGPVGHETEMYWTIEVSDAQSNVVINGNVLHALRAHRGMTIGCGLSRMAIDETNAAAFPHPALLASFTKATAIIMDKLKKDGSPAHGILYDHSPWAWRTIAIGLAHRAAKAEDILLLKTGKIRPWAYFENTTWRTIAIGWRRRQSKAATWPHLKLSDAAT